MNQKTLGVLLYIDDTPHMIEEFSWIYKSWIHSGNWKTSDLIAICNPLAFDKLPDEPGVVRIPHPPLSGQPGPWEGYRFINSIACLSGPHTDELASRYTHFLRTDADVFLTHKLVDFRPNVPVHGRGHYADRADVRERLLDFAARHGIDHHGVFNCGSSLLSSCDDVIYFLRDQVMVCNWLLDDFRDDPGQWPGWNRGLITMYAAELVADHHYHRFTMFGIYNMLDFESNLQSNISKTNIYHIHAGPAVEHWSKFDYRAGTYKDYDISKLDHSLVNNYCHWIAETSVGDIKAMAGYSD